MLKRPARCSILLPTLFIIPVQSHLQLPQYRHLPSSGLYAVLDMRGQAPPKRHILSSFVRPLRGATIIPAMVHVSVWTPVLGSCILSPLMSGINRIVPFSMRGQPGGRPAGWSAALCMRWTLALINHAFECSGGEAAG